MEKNIALLCPGQGSQYPGMIKNLLQEFSYTQDIFEEASEGLKENIVKLIMDSTEDELQLTHNAQPTILTTSFAWYQVLKRELDFKPVASAGHSLGEYTSLLCADAISLMEAAPLVRKRGELMQNAVPVGHGKMAALLGMEDDKVKALCEAASEGPTSIVRPANWNAPGQVVIAGHAGAVDRAEALTKSDPEFKARKVIPLKVSAPFHSPLMKPVADQFEVYLKAVNWKHLSFPIACNFDGMLREQGNWATLLTAQIHNPVLWTADVKTLNSRGITTFVEVGPNKVLTGLTKRIVDGVKTFSIDGSEDFKLFETFWRAS